MEGGVDVYLPSTKYIRIIREEPHEVYLKPTDSWCLRYLIDREGEHAMNYTIFYYVNDHFKSIQFWKLMQRPWISLVESNWNKSALHLVEFFIYLLVEVPSSTMDEFT